MITNTVNLLDSSTLDPNPPPAIDFLVRKQQGFCYFVIPQQEGQATNPSAISEESPWSSMCTVIASHCRDLLCADFAQSNVIVADARDIRLCDFSSVKHIDPWHLMFSYFVRSSDTNLDTPQISPANESIVEDVRNLLISFSYEPFDTQASYDLTDGFDELVARIGKPVVRALAKLIREQKLTDNLISEALVSIGRLQDDNTKNERFDLLIDLLHHRAPIVRDGAIAGLSFMDDRKAIPYLRKALLLETIHTLKGNIEIAIKDLETS